MSQPQPDRYDAATACQEIVAAARALSPVLRAGAEQAERDSRLTEVSAAALRRAGMFRLGAPMSHGGHEATLVTVLEATAELARADPSSSWVVSLFYGGQQLAGSFGDQVRQELWAESPDVPICGSFTGADLAATKVAGGQLLSGRWVSASGAYQARWALLGMPVVDEHGVVVDRALAAVPMTELTIEDSWNMVGMRGTGSHTLVADRVFVPDHRARSFTRIVHGPVEPVEPLYRVPLSAVSIVLAGTVLGTAREVFDQTMQVVESGKPLAMSNYPRLADSPGIQANLADAANLIDSAWLHLHRSAARVDELAATGAEFDLNTRARVRMDAGYATRCLRDAVHLLLSVGGAGSFSRANLVQRYWRDLETAARHPALSAELSREIYGRALVGSNEQVSEMI
jgi:alkylation response protein AidB-like acyl-CoA dehydrogenase